jgi:hypothetical protein
VRVTLWGTRGSQATPGPETVRYGGNTSCVEVRNMAGDVVVLDAGTGIRRLGGSLIGSVARVDVLLTHDHGVVTYLPDHEPAIVARSGSHPDWRSGHALAADTELLIRDAQYTNREYPERVGWGHSTLDHALDFAVMVGARCLMPFHHDPDHDDALLDRLFADAQRRAMGRCELLPAREGVTVEVPNTAVCGAVDALPVASLEPGAATVTSPMLRGGRRGRTG